MVNNRRSAGLEPGGVHGQHFNPSAIGVPPALLPLLTGSNFECVLLAIFSDNYCNLKFIFNDALYLLLTLSSPIYSKAKLCVFAAVWVVIPRETENGKKRRKRKREEINCCSYGIVQ